ncbi:tetratricopeptide repeat-containing sensor histidine kinase [Fulvivirga maritima]|uniref:tetratricopeptide repeat-containing sensor histidine kinase n=1 Tax=Fulvivirga maritima TaxID=2904247 RepID=UPI001F3D8657|nr:tetratricopeptide repeat-containing sensor histidine kinase [Fulvivirga maritima]UII26506.1 tetratricopeptide repeat-containing sensor histidine kinase [Fulvivirga maritima]
MNRGLLILTILFGFLACAKGQSNKIKENKFLDPVRQTHNPDSSKMEALFKLVYEYDLDNIDTSIYLANKIRKLAIASNSLMYQAEADVKLAYYYNVQSQYQKALKLDLEALKLFEKLGDGESMMMCLNNIGEDYFDLDLFSDAYDYYQQSLRKAREEENKLYIAISTYNIGRVLKAMGQLEKAMEYIQNSLELSRVINDSEGIAYSYHDIGEILILESEYKQALVKLHEALKVSRRLSLKVLTPKIMHKIAIAHENLKEFKQALHYHDSSMAIYQTINNKSGMAEAFLGKGVVYRKMSSYDKANSLLNRSLEMSDNIQDRDLMIEGYHELSLLYERRRLFEQSLNYYKKYKALQDSLFGEKRSEQFAQIQLKYETANKDMEIAFLSQQEEQQKRQLENEEFFRNILVVILAFTAVLLITLYRSSLRRKKINRLLLQHQQEMEEQSREMSGLLAMKDKFFSILSHDLRSPINAIIGILDMVESGYVTQEELLQLTKSLKLRLLSTKKLLGNLMDWALIQMNEITIKEEDIDLHQLAAENINFFRDTNDKNIQFINSIPEGTVVHTDRNMLDLIIRNLASNAMKFTEEEGLVELACQDKDQEWLILKVIDNGIGMSQEQQNILFTNASGLHTTRGTANEEGTGLGLKLCKEFVERMGGDIWVESEEGKGTTFLFTVKKSLQ